MGNHQGRSRTVYGARLRHERRRLRLTQRQMAEATGIAAPKLCMMENGTQEIRAKALVQLGGAGVDILFVLTGRAGRQADAAAAELLTSYEHLRADLQAHVRSFALALAGHVQAGQGVKKASGVNGRDLRLPPDIDARAATARK